MYIYLILFVIFCPPNVSSWLPNSLGTFFFHLIFSFCCDLLIVVHFYKFTYLFVIFIDGAMMCTASVVVVVDAELHKSSAAEAAVSQYQDRIISQSRALLSSDSPDQIQHGCDKLGENLWSLGLQTRLVLLLSRANSIALYFLCMTLSAITSLRDQWRHGELRPIVESIFTIFLDGTHKVRVEKLSWPLTDYDRCLEFFSPQNGK